mgnify:CR=1 FL=1
MDGAKDAAGDHAPTVPLDVHGHPIDPAGDCVHVPPVGVARWTENIQWNVVGSDGLGVTWHIGTMLDDPSLWHIVVTVVRPDGAVFTDKQVAPGIGSFGSPSAHLATVEPFVKWKFHYRGAMLPVRPGAAAASLLVDDNHIPVSVELTLTAAYPVWLPSGSEVHGDWGRFHHEQAVVATGQIVVGGEPLAFSGVGHRDHSIGPRDLSRLRRAFWGNGIFESGWAFATMQGEYDEGDFQRAAVFIGDDFFEVLMTDWTVLDDADGSPKDISVRLSADGWERVIKGRIHAGMSFTLADGAEYCLGTDRTNPHRYMMTNMFVHWECAGEPGSGYLDRGARISLLR